jgi:hypothetical protein
MSNLTFPNEPPLPPEVQVIVNAETVRQSIDDWIANCPDPDFVNILDPEFE